MNKVVVLDKFGHVKEFQTTVVPRIGDQVDIGYTPYPEVTAVLWYPTDEDFVDENTLAIVTVG